MPRDRLAGRGLITQSLNGVEASLNDVEAMFGRAGVFRDAEGFQREDRYAWPSVGCAACSEGGAETRPTIDPGTTLARHSQDPVEAMRGRARRAFLRHDRDP